MSIEHVRLSEFVSLHALAHGTNLQAAAFDLQALIQSLTHRYLNRSGKSIPEGLVWVGGISSPSRSAMPYEVDYSSLLGYFEAWSKSSQQDAPLCMCYSIADREYKPIPAQCIYFDRRKLVEWISVANLVCPSFLADRVSSSTPVVDEEALAHKGKELVSINGLMQGLINIIIAVDKAHRGALDKGHLADIKHLVVQLEGEIDEKSPNWHSTLVELADLVGADDFRRNPKTLKKYIGF